MIMTQHNDGRSGPESPSFYTIPHRIPDHPLSVCMLFVPSLSSAIGKSITSLPTYLAMSPLLCASYLLDRYDIATVWHVQREKNAAARGDKLG